VKRIVYYNFIFKGEGYWYFYDWADGQYNSLISLSYIDCDFSGLTTCKPFSNLCGHPHYFYLKNKYNNNTLNLTQLTDLECTFQGIKNEVFNFTIDFSNGFQTDDLFLGEFRKNTTMKVAPNFIFGPNLWRLTNFFYNCEALTICPELDISTGAANHEVDCSNMLYNCTNLTFFGGIKGLNNDLDISRCSKLTLESLKNIAEKAADVKNIGGKEIIMSMGSRIKIDHEENLSLTFFNKGWSTLVTGEAN
jgi:hypothetical protein